MAGGAYGTGLALVARLVPGDAAPLCVAGVAWRHRPSLCVAGVELGDIDLHFVWQAWHLVTSTFSLCGKCGKYGTGLAPVARLVRGDAPLCVAGVALGDIDLHFVWHAWHLVTSTCTLHEMAWHFRHWAGSGGALTARGWLWWCAWFPLTMLMLCGTRGTFGTGLALVARLVSIFCGRRGAWGPVGFWWRAWFLVAPLHFVWQAASTWCHRPALCVAALGDIGVHFVWQAWHWWYGALSHTTLSRTISLPPSPRYSHTLSHTQFSHTQPFHTHTHTQLSHTQLTPKALSHTALSYVPLSHNLSSTISTQLTHTFSDTTCGARNLLKHNSLTRNSHTYLFHTICLPPSPQNSLLLFSNTLDKPSHTQPSHTELHSICLPPSPFSFLPFPSRLHLAFATYWKTWHVGLSGPLTVFALTFDRNMKQQWENLPGIPKSCMQSSLRLDKDLSFSTCNNEPIG